jgi:hypothetical protein
MSAEPVTPGILSSNRLSCFSRDRRSPELAKTIDVALVAFGVVGGATLSLLMLSKLFAALVMGALGGTAFGRALASVALVFATGFVCGVIAWAGRRLHRRIGWLGDSIVGIIVALVFFTICLVVFEPDLLDGKLEKIGFPMLGIAVVIGAICGPWFARDLRKIEP